MTLLSHSFCRVFDCMFWLRMCFVNSCYVDVFYVPLTDESGSDTSSFPAQAEHPSESVRSVRSSTRRRTSKRGPSDSSFASDEGNSSSSAALADNELDSNSSRGILIVLISLQNSIRLLSWFCLSFLCLDFVYVCLFVCLLLL